LLGASPFPLPSPYTPRAVFILFFFVPTASTRGLRSFLFLLFHHRANKPFPPIANWGMGLVCLSPPFVLFLPGAPEARKPSICLSSSSLAFVDVLSPLFFPPFLQDDFESNLARFFPTSRLRVALRVQLSPPLPLFPLLFFTRPGACWPLGSPGRDSMPRAASSFPSSSLFLFSAEFDSKSPGRVHVVLRKATTALCLPFSSPPLPFLLPR